MQQSYGREHRLDDTHCSEELIQLVVESNILVDPGPFALGSSGIDAIYLYSNHYSTISLFTLNDASS